jgi:hypothetical protein
MSSVAWIDESERTALVKDADQWSEMAERVRHFAVVDDETAAFAAEMAKKARNVHRALEEKRKTITTPLLAAKNATDALFKPTLDAVASIKRHYEQAIAVYDREREEARARVLAESAAQIARKEVPTEIIPAPVHVEKTSVRHVWEPEIVEPDLVPREYCSPDVKKIREAIWYADTHKPPREIPGVRFVPKSIVVVR